MTDIWELHSQGYWAVIPTNLQWNSRGLAVMGAGLAAQCARRFPHIPRRYGRHLQRYAYPNQVYYDLEFRIICLATKNHWKNAGDEKIMNEHLVQLSRWLQLNEGINVVMPRIGCGLAGGDWNDVKQTIQDILPRGRYTFCEE